MGLVASCSRNPELILNLTHDILQVCSLAYSLCLALYLTGVRRQWHDEHQGDGSALLGRRLLRLILQVSYPLTRGEG